MNQNITLDVLYGYKKSHSTLHDAIHDAVHLDKSFIFDKYEFKFINGEYEIHVDGNSYKDAYDFLLAYPDDFDTYMYEGSIMSNEAIENNDFTALMRYAKINNGRIFVYDVSKKIYEYHKSSDKDATIKTLVDNKVPFRYISDDPECSKTYYVNNINGIYSYFEPMEFTTETDIKNAEIFKILQLT